MTRIYSAGAAVKGMIVDSTGAALVRSTSQTRAQEAAVEGEGFNINTGLINLTSANESVVLYYKHFEDKPLIVDAIVFGMEDNGTDVNVTCPLTIVKNPSTGTIISTATAVDILENRNFGSVNALDNSIAYKGAEGHTVTNGSDWGIVYTGTGRSMYSFDLVLNKGNSIAVKIDPVANTLTDIDIYCALICHLKQGD